MRFLEVTLFLGLSAAVHAAVFVGVPSVGTQGSGEGGTAQISISAPNATAQNLVQDWTRPPAVAPAPARFSPPQIAGVPALPIPTERAALAAPTPLLQPAPVTEAAPILHNPAPQERAVLDQAEGLETSPRPMERPAHRPAQPAAADAPPVVQVARGTGGAQSQGASPDPAQAPGLSAGQRNTLMSQWGAAIISRVERNRPNVAHSGAVSLRISVARNGTLEGLAVIGSSGNPDLDQAALRAVQRARRFPAAPDGLTDASYRFDLPIRFQ